jgi:GDP-4-dehydro-6-deoxy-D-mannose reductase
MQVLITGITGFVGGHLADWLLAEGGHTVCGLSHTGRWPAALAHLSGKVPLHTADLLDTPAVEAVVRQVQPDWVFHLAGYASPRQSLKEPEACWKLNLDGSRSVFTAVLNSGLRPRVLFTSTGLVYGNPDPGRTDIDETTALKPSDPYTQSKVAADTLAVELHASGALDVLVVRMFNTIGPRQSADYAIANFARQVAAIERGEQPLVLKTGDLSAYRDLTDVRDMVRALRLVIEKGQGGQVYNAGSGRVYQMKQIVELLVGMPHELPITVESQPPPAVPTTVISRANPAKLKAATGWEPRYPLDRTLTDVLNDWRRK